MIVSHFQFLRFGKYEFVVRLDNVSMLLMAEKFTRRFVYNRKRNAEKGLVRDSDMC